MVELPFQTQEKPKDEKKPAAGGLFAAKPKVDEAAESKKRVDNLMNTVSDVVRRLRVLEERYNNLSKKGQVTEENMLGSFKKINVELKTFSDDISEFKKNIKINDQRTELIIKELQLTAKKEDVNVLERYLEMWQPVAFVTQNEVEKIVKDKVAEIMAKPKI